MRSSNSYDLHTAYEAAFHYSFSNRSWRSKPARRCWLDLEGWQDALAGPVSSIVKRGNCAYVYERDDVYFSGVTDPDALLARLRQWHGRLTEGLDRFVPETTAEEADLAMMRGLAREMWSVAERAMEIERDRWARSGGGPEGGADGM